MGFEGSAFIYRAFVAGWSISGRLRFRCKCGRFRFVADVDVLGVDGPYLDAFDSLQMWTL